jgi:predicted DNA-binding protein
MSVPDSSTSRGSVKTLAIRLEPDLHAQLSLIAQLRGKTITDEIRTALEAHIASAKNAPELAAQADNVLNDIEREALARREAIATLFGTASPATPETTDTSGRSRGRKTGSREGGTSAS